MEFLYLNEDDFCALMCLEGTLKALQSRAE
jgi:hypothetical protein